mmetsp:Transcript_12118/g.15861  ORF Transcript_12118/g.15861 Transcript_12118/m.15861 type:complete len:219 (+) Transcript_12118:131-787(+)|eukprot:CAMPEP_0198137614 /NCGR_PEP_ID=MMETSP1443-20131203/1090_1 /TAXON_ID=186043 /ORGANISM="Entomoneis sp., Strain CCMP2396" /LENGTH=218 /DNA_ID=CAMNT_0043799109 /DNA_START=88 /DNA_END=744 /DNA_ORIENTATION=+
MVFYFKSRCGEYTLYMGRDKYENEDLIKYGWPEDVWFHVDDLSSAHVYLRMKPGMSLDGINDDLLLDCSSLVKANSILGCKKASVYVVYTRWKNLKKTNDMVEGQVSYHRPENVKRISVEKNNTIVRALEKTKEELHPDFAAEQARRLRQIQQEQKAEYKKSAEAKKASKQQVMQEKEARLEARSYDRIMNEDQMTSTKDVEGTADSTAAEEYEEDFF